MEASPVEKAGAVPLDFLGQTALVTGTARGLGVALARGFFDRGANVVLADIDTAANDETFRSLGGDAQRLQCVTVDLADPVAVVRAFAAAAERWGAIDILVNNAAQARAVSLWEIDLADWQQVLSVNLTGLFVLSRLAAAAMRARGAGRIVNIASLAGQMARPSGAHYAASKGGVIALTRVFAAELAASGVTVNAVAPAIVDTPMFQAIGPERAEALKAAIPVKRVGTPEEVAALVCFLASPAAGFITGATYDINGGVLMR
jgi:3-oxoacyl-[acyl-carrier protein] reductase